MVSLLKELFTFLRNPTQFDLSKHPLQERVPFYLIQMLFVMIVIDLATGFIIGLPIELLSGIDYHELVKVKFVALLQKEGPLIFIALGCIIAPIMEEASFRLGLSFKRLHVAIALGCLVFIVMRIVCQAIPLPLVVGVVAIGSFYFLLKDEQLLRYRKRFGNITIYVMLIAFPLMHIPNITLPDLSYWYVYIPYLLALFVSSLIFCFVRLRVGFFSAVILHGVGNAIALVPLVLCYYLKAA